MKSKLSALLCAFSIFLAGCIGTPFRWETARQVTVGMTTEEVKEIMGKPYIISSAGDSEIWRWSYGTGLGTGASYSIVIKDGKVVEVPRISDEL